MEHAACTCHASPAIDRRGFIALTAAATGGALLPRFAHAADGTDALLLNCIDYRLTGKTTAYMNGQGLAGRYDQMILAGGALGALTPKFPDWGRTFRQHLDLAIELHHIREVIVIDHRDCGAYKVLLGKDYASDPPAETRIHAEMLHKLSHQIHRAHPKLAIRLGLMALDGSVEPIA